MTAVTHTHTLCLPFFYFLLKLKINSINTSLLSFSNNLFLLLLQLTTSLWRTKIGKLTFKIYIAKISSKNILLSCNGKDEQNRTRIFFLVAKLCTRKPTPS